MQVGMQVEDAALDATGKQLKKDASSKCKTRQKLQNKKLEMQKCKAKTAEMMRLESKTPDKAEAGKGATYDWALDLEPLALPPDLPPVILRDLGFGGKGGKISELGAEDGLGACGGRGVSRRWIACWWWGATLAYKDGAGVSRSARSTGRLARPELWQSGRARLRKITLSSLSWPTTRRRARPSIAALIQQEAASTGPPGAAGSQHAARSP